MYATVYNIILYINRGLLFSFFLCHLFIVLSLYDLWDLPLVVACHRVSAYDVYALDVSENCIFFKSRLNALHSVFSFLVNYTYFTCNSLISLFNSIISVICSQSSSSYWKGMGSNIWFLIYCLMFSQSFSMAFHFELKLLNIYACVRRELIVWS